MTYGIKNIGAVWDLWRKIVKIDLKSDPKMVKIESTVQYSRLMNQNSDAAVLKIPPNDSWRSGAIKFFPAITEI